MRTALLAIAAGAIASACGSASAPRTAESLPAAGSPTDDGSGLLFGLSVAPRLGPAERAADADDDGDDGDASTEADEESARYGSYRFEIEHRPSAAAPKPYAAGYTATAVADGGDIEGKVSWTRPPAAPAALAGSPDECEGGVPTPSPSVEGGRVQGAIVYLEDIGRGRSHPDAHHASRRPQTGGVLVWRGCRLAPHVQVVVPIGGVLTVTRLEPGDRSLRASRWTSDGPAEAAAFDVRLAGRGAVTEQPLDLDGIYLLEPAEGPAAIHAWVAVAGHPYYVTTGEAGDFRLEDVPPGTYSLVVWHPPVVVGAGDDGGLARTPPAVERRRVRVRTGQVTRLEVDLPAVPRKP